MQDEKVITREQATADYMAGMPYAALAEKYDVSLNTVKSWKQRWGWDRKGVHTNAPRAKAASVQKDAAQKDAERVPKRPVPDYDNKLTEKERLFCEYYVEHFNATEAIRKVGYSHKSAKQAAYMVIHRPQCKRYIEKLKDWKREMLLAGPEDILERYLRIAFSDIGEVVTFGKREVPVLDSYGFALTRTDEAGNKVPVTQIVSYVDINEAANVDTSLISEISQGRDGAVKVKMVDPRGAMEFLRQYFNMNPMDKHRIAYENAKLELEKKESNADPVTVVIEDDYGDGG